MGRRCLGRPDGGGHAYPAHPSRHDNFAHLAHAALEAGERDIHARRALGRARNAVCRPGGTRHRVRELRRGDGPQDARGVARRGLDVLTGLWHGQPFAYDGKHYHITPTDFTNAPALAQKPRIPIWVVGAWPFEKSMQRALKYDGLIPSVRGEDGGIRQPTPDELREITQGVARRHEGGMADYDIIVEGTNPRRTARAPSPRCSRGSMPAPRGSTRRAGA